MSTAYYSHAECRLHDMGAGHPECPQRLDAISDQRGQHGDALIDGGIADGHQIELGALGADLETEDFPLARERHDDVITRNRGIDRTLRHSARFATGVDQSSQLLAHHSPDGEQRFHDSGHLRKAFDQLADP